VLWEVGRAVQVLDREAELQRAIARNEFILHYQPIIDLSTGIIAAVEALARWQHPDLGLLSPYEFIPLAEETGLIQSLGLRLVEQACQAAVRWPQTSEAVPLLNVNLSPRHLQQRDLVERMGTILQQTGLAPGQLQLELTESAMLLDAREAQAVLHGLKALGIYIAIDDFGAGYSSLARLHSFEVDSLKIDQSFISAITLSGGSWKIVQAIIGLAHALGMTTIAEGIETVEQLDLVRSAGCDLGQGYYFHYPMPEEELVAILRAGRHRD
jgi:EAL domain-containing protein (putative c-di-GMP-specific phosphodiesterase class I)